MSDLMTIDDFNSFTCENYECISSKTGSYMGYFEYNTAWLGYTSEKSLMLNNDVIDWSDASYYFSIGAALYITLFVFCKKIAFVLKMIRN